MKKNFPPLKRVKVNDWSISCILQERGQNSIVFVHGLGASKETFLEAFSREEFQTFSMLATDLVGFGDSDKPADFSYLMKDQAKILERTIDVFGLDRFHLVAHSMGGIIGIELGEMIPQRLCSFINVEGNVTAEDCTMSKQVAEMGEEHFVQEGFDALKRAIAKEAKRTENRTLEDYLKSLSKATSKSFYGSSTSTVRESNRSDLLTRFSKLPFYKCYIYGEENKGVFPAEDMLRHEGIPLFYVSRSGHSMMKENPEEFYGLVLRIIQQCS